MQVFRAGLFFNKGMVFKSAAQAAAYIKAWRLEGPDAKNSKLLVPALAREIRHGRWAVSATNYHEGTQAHVTITKIEGKLTLVVS